MQLVDVSFLRLSSGIQGHHSLYKRACLHHEGGDGNDGDHGGNGDDIDKCNGVKSVAVEWLYASHFSEVAKSSMLTIGPLSQVS